MAGTKRDFTENAGTYSESCTKIMPWSVPNFPGTPDGAAGEPVVQRRCLSIRIEVLSCQPATE